MDLTIIVVNWNTKDLVLACVKSIYRHKPKSSFEVIVVDNGSSDGSSGALKELKLPNLKIIKNSENLGFSKANNIGIKKADGNYVLLLNSDTQVKKGAIDKLLNFAKSKEDIGVVGTRLLNADGSLQESCFQSPGIINTLKQYWFGEGEAGKYAPKGKNAVEVDAVVGASFLITPEARRKVGLLDEKYFFYWEDLAYCKKVKKKGLKVYYLPTSEVYHYHGSTVKKVVDKNEAWKKLIPGSKIYHGLFKHYLITWIIWLSQKLKGFLLPLLVIFLISPVYLKLFQPGFFAMQDDLQAFRVNQMDRCFDDGQIPCRWVPDAGYQYGYPQFNYYPPLPYYVGALLHRVGFQYIDSVKILFIFGYIASAIAMYLLVKELLGKWPAFISALLYTYIPYKGVEVYVRGALNEFWAQIFFPIIFLGIYLVIKNKKIKYVLLLSLLISGLLTTHLLMSIIFTPIAFIWAVYWLLVFNKKRALSFKRLATSGLLAFGLSAFFVLPAFFEKQFVHLESVLSGYFDYRQHFVGLKKLFFSMEWGYGSSGFPDEKLNLSLGIPHWIVGIFVGVLSALVLIRKRKKAQKSGFYLLLLVLCLITIFMIHIRSSFFWSLMPFLFFLQFPWRFLAVSIFLLILMCGTVVYLSGKWRYILGVLTVLSSMVLYSGFFIPKEWFFISDNEKFSGKNWEKQLTISIFDYLPKSAKLPPNIKAPFFPEVLTGKASFTEYKKGSNFHEGVVVVEENSLIRIPMYDFPGMKVKLGGNEIPYTTDCRGQDFCFGLITINVPRGDHVVEVKLTDTPIRRFANWTSLLSLAVFAYLGVKSIKRGKNLKK